MSTMRLQELHPSLVHMPIALLPLSIGADTLGRLTGREWLLKAGQWGMALTVGTATLAAVSGLIAQEEVEAEGEAREMLVTHRTLNVAALGLTTAMMVRRFRRRRPSLRYLATGFAGIGTLMYSAYLGGKMVYEHGVGVRAAGGVRTRRAPFLTPREAGEVAQHAVEDLKQGVRHMAEDFRAGEIVPRLTRSDRPRAGDGAPPV